MFVKTLNIYLTCTRDKKCSSWLFFKGNNTIQVEIYHAYFFFSTKRAFWLRMKRILQNCTYTWNNRTSIFARAWARSFVVVGTGQWKRFATQRYIDVCTWRCTETLLIKSKTILGRRTSR